MLDKCMQCTPKNKEALENVIAGLPGTAFQKQVWLQVALIPHGETMSYGDIAKRIGRPKAVRAVGTAVGKNPVPLVIPCHRVVPSSGGIGNYHYGSDMKQSLLNLESHR